MTLKSRMKHAVLGPPGERMRTIKLGLLRGKRFPLDMADASMKLVGLWETEIMSAVRRMASRARTACDIGSNTGWYSLYFASQQGIVRVLGFEPDAALIAQATTILQANDPALLGKVRFHQALVGNRDDEGWVRLDSALAHEQEPIALKIDVDGGEVDVLRGAEHTLTSRPCELVIETHSIALERECIAYLHALGYQTRIIKNGWYRAIIPEHRHTDQNRWLWAGRHA